MSVNIVIDPPRNVRPDGAIRCDVAWKLYLPDEMGDLPEGGGSGLVRFNNWLWTELSDRLGYLKKDLKSEIYLLTPMLTDAAREYLVRICSIWSDDVRVLESTGGEVNLGNKGENRWRLPVFNLQDGSKDDPSVSKFTEEYEGLRETSISPLLGSTRSYMRTYVIPPNGTYARMHSHTAREETYIVLEGKGSVRYGGHIADIKEGDLISKPLGPDVPSQLLADKGVPIKILDIEIWPDSTRQAKDVVHYPDHGELDLLGPGWHIMIPDKNLHSARDAFANYHTGYERNADGSWVPKEVPGLRPRKEKS